MLLIDDQESEIPEYYSLPEDSVGSDDTVDRPVRKPLEDFPDFPRFAETREYGETHAERRKPLPQGFNVFIGEDDERRYENGLFSIQKSPVDCVHRHLRFPEPDVSRKESVHRLGRLHIDKYFFYGSCLVLGVFIRKIFAKPGFLSWKRPI